MLSIDDKNCIMYCIFYTYTKLSYPLLAKFGNYVLLTKTKAALQ